MNIDRYLNEHIYAVHVTVLLCVFSSDNEEKNASETNYKLDCIFGEIQTATTTFIARLTIFNGTADCLRQELLRSAHHHLSAVPPS